MDGTWDMGHGTWVWVDVDGTSETGEPIEAARIKANCTLHAPLGRAFNWNEPLFCALQSNGCRSVMLFTAYNAKGAGNCWHPLRCELCEWLTARGIHVEGVATLLDPVYGGGPGAYFRDVIEPVERTAQRTCTHEGYSVGRTASVMTSSGEKTYEAIVAEEARLYEAFDRRFGQAPDKRELAHRTAQHK